MKPFIKYPGSKRWLTDLLAPHIKTRLVDSYMEPFLGSGAMYFAVDPDFSILSDINPHLTNLFQCLSSHNQEVCSVLADIADAYLRQDDVVRKGMYYDLRDRYNSYVRLDQTAAATLLFLLRTCYNGLIRFNRKGKFNTPHGDYKNPKFGLEALAAAHGPLSHALVLTRDFEGTMRLANTGDVVYLDPPYHGGFTGYNPGGFGWSDQLRLHDEALSCLWRGAAVFASLPDTGEMRTLWMSDEFHAYSIPVRRSISCRAETRGDVRELLVYGPESDLPGFEVYEKVF